MNPLSDRRVQIAVGALAAVLLAVLLGIFVTRQGGAKKGEDAGPRAGLTVDASREEPKVSQTKPLRCFVGGQYVGDMPIAACAQRNGVAAQALDVGLDPQTGQVAGGATALQPLPAPTSAAAPAPTPPAAEVSIASAGSPGGSGAAQCLRYSGGEWRGAGSVGSIGQCIRVLFDGQCVRAGDALYGRYGALTLRLVPGRVEVSPDNRSFRPMQAQDEDCTLQPG